MKKLFLLSLIATLFMSPIMTIAKNDSLTDKSGKLNIKKHIIVKTTTITEKGDTSTSTVTWGDKDVDKTIDSLSTHGFNKIIPSILNAGGNDDSTFDMVFNMTNRIMSILGIIIILPIVLIVLLIIIILMQRHKKDKMVKEILIANKEIPAELISPQKSYTKRGIENICLGLGLMLLWAVLSDNFWVGCAIGGLVIFIGIGKLIIGRLEKNEQKSKSTDNE